MLWCKHTCIDWTWRLAHTCQKYLLFQQYQHLTNMKHTTKPMTIVAQHFWKQRGRLIWEANIKLNNIEILKVESNMNCMDMPQGFVYNTLRGTSELCHHCRGRCSSCFGMQSTEVQTTIRRAFSSIRPVWNGCPLLAWKLPSLRVSYHAISDDRRTLSTLLRHHPCINWLCWQVLHKQWLASPPLHFKHLHRFGSLPKPCVLTPIQPVHLVSITPSQQK